MTSFSDIVIMAVADELEVAVSEIERNALLVDQLHMDSLAMLSMVARVEEAMGSEWKSVWKIDIASATVADLTRLED